jgi:hypothetical protein
MISTLVLLLQFVVPAGWTVDADNAKTFHAEVYAADRRIQPAASMIGLRMAKPMPTPDDAFASGFIEGARKKATTLVEARHDFIDIGGQKSARIIGDLTVDGLMMRQAYYLMPAGDETAILIVSDERDAFDARLGEFDDIARATRGLAESTDSDDGRAYHLGYLVGRAIGSLAVLGLVIFGVLALVRALRKPRA